MRSTILGATMLSAALSVPVLAQMSPATPDRNPPAAAAEESIRPGVQPPAPDTSSGANVPHTGSDRTAVGGGQDRATAPAARDHTPTGTAAPMRGTEGGTRAVQLDGGTRLGPLEPGANSFTEEQARSRIEAAGFSNITNLAKDDQGIWRGRGMQGGQEVMVGLDYRGNVAAVQ